MYKIYFATIEKDYFCAADSVYDLNVSTQQITDYKCGKTVFIHIHISQRIHNVFIVIVRTR